MKMHFKPQEKLQVAVPSSRLFSDWLNGELAASFIRADHGSASVELDRALATATGSGEPAPLFRSSWVSGWARGMEEDLPGVEDRAGFRRNLELLTDGSARIVVTGQQPGFLGGPLYTLYKIATAVELARKRTAAGHLTIPVFWSGDDDDDLAEALDPVAWDPDTRGTVQGASNIVAGRRPPIIGRLTGGSWITDAAAWLEKRASGNDLAGDLAGIWRRALSEELPWSRLTRRLVLRLFRGTGLCVVSGDDPGLHAAALPLYERILANGPRLRNVASRRGGELGEAGWHAQISDRSLARSIFLVEDDRRVPKPVPDLPAEVSDLRPGVMLRSPVQDWLLEPAAVVVGPGELAYLRQLDTVYRELAIPRSPLVPRLFAWETPVGFSPDRLLEFSRSGTGDPHRAEELADRAADKAGSILVDILTGELGLAPERASDLAAGRTRRWRKGVAAMLAAELNRKQERELAAGPGWVFLAGQRQERKLAMGCAAAFWGDGFTASVMAAARDHLEYGTRGDWREFVLEVTEP